MEHLHGTVIRNRRIEKNIKKVNDHKVGANALFLSLHIFSYCHDRLVDFYVFLSPHLLSALN